MKLFLIIVLIILVFLLGMTYYFFNTVFNRDKLVPLSPLGNSAYSDANEEGNRWLKAHKDTEELSVISFDGLKLKGLYIRNKHKDRTILCVHGYQMSGLRDFGMSIEFLCSTGYNVLLVDDRAHGTSEGRYTGFSILDSKDTVTWCKYLVNELKQAQIVLYGISMGGAAVLNASGNSELPKEVKGIVSDCAFADAFKEISHQIRRSYHLPSFPIVNLYDMWLRIFAKYSLKEQKPGDSVRNYRKPLLIIHGDKDHLVPVENAYGIYDNANGDKGLFIVPGAVHGRSYLTDKEGYERKFKELLKKADEFQP